MMKQAESPWTTSEFIGSVVKNSRVVDKNEILEPGDSINSVYAPIIRKLMKLKSGSALIVDFGSTQFMNNGRGVAIRNLCNKNGLRLRSKNVGGTKVALWVEKI